MIPTAEKIARLLALCNKFKDRVIAYKNDSFYEYANVCWSLAYFYSQREQIEGLEMIYEDAGDDSYYDLLGLKIGCAYACIPVPNVCPTVVGTFAKKAKIVDKYDHEREKRSDSSDLGWEKLYPELVFLSLYTYVLDHSILVSIDDLGLINKPQQIIPENPSVPNIRGAKYNPVHDEKMFKEYQYSGYSFKSWILLEQVFA